MPGLFDWLKSATRPFQKTKSYSGPSHSTQLASTMKEQLTELLRVKGLLSLSDDSLRDIMSYTKKPDALSLSLTCHRAHDAAIPELYKNLRLKAAQLELLQTTLEKHSDRYKYVKYLFYAQEEQQGGGWMITRLLLPIIPILSRCVNLERWGFTDLDHGSLMQRQQFKFLTTFEHLRVLESPANAPAWTFFPRGMTIELLILDETSCTGWETKNPESEDPVNELRLAFPTLKEIRILNHEIGGDQFLFTWSSYPTVKTYCMDLIDKDELLHLVKEGKGVIQKIEVEATSTRYPTVHLYHFSNLKITMDQSITDVDNAPPPSLKITTKSHSYDIAQLYGELVKTSGAKEVLLIEHATERITLPKEAWRTDLEELVANMQGMADDACRLARQNAIRGMYLSEGAEMSLTFVKHSHGTFWGANKNKPLYSYTLSSRSE